MSEIKITNSTAKVELLKEWTYRKGNQPWTLEEISELIADATWLAEQRIIKLLEEWGEKAGCFCCASDAAASEIIAFIKGEITSEEL